MTHRFGTPLPRLLLATSLAGLLLLAVALVLRAGGAPGRDDASGVPSGSTGVAHTGTPPALGRHRPNIVFVLTDDLSMDLLRYMPAVQRLATRGMTFGNYFVSDSLCCPSRASIFTGDFPHDTRVFTNNGPHGGMAAWIGQGDQRRTFNVALQNAGYRTAMMGKYINGYLEGARRSPVPGRYVPPGWNEWDVAGWGYPEFDYRMNIDGTVHYFGNRPRDYLTSVLARRGVRFIEGSARSRRPFFLELATFSPHYPYTPAPRDAGRFPHLEPPLPPSFDRLPTHAPAWLADHPPLGQAQLLQIDRAVRRRVEAVQSVDRMLATVQATLRRLHLLRNTYIVFSSDNGLHAGEYRMMPGKLTAFDTDIHVPLVVAGPGIAPGSSTDAMAENVDLADTFAQIGGTSMSTDGYSLLPLLRGTSRTGWRDAVLVEHRHPVPSVHDPDRQSSVSGNPPSYEAIRTKEFLYVEYADGEREFYDLRTDPYELDNLAGSLSPGQVAVLHAELARLEACHGPASCWSDGHVDTAIHVTRGHR